MFGKAKKAQLQAVEDGPLEYRGAQGSQKDAVLTDAAGQSMQLTGGERLCRCGGSSVKPFCDGAHSSNGYSSARARHVIPSARTDYDAGVFTIHDVRGVCAHVERCTKGLPEVFQQKAKPWVHADGAAIDAAVRIIRACPSGALTYSIGGEYYGDWEGDPKILADENGPYEVSGNIELPGVEFASTVPTDHFTLCRCGGSKNKPFCDGTHWHNGFKDPDGTFVGGSAALVADSEGETGDHGGPASE